MRTELAKLAGQRIRIRGRFGRYGSYPKIITPPIRTFILEDIQNIDGIVLADHLWLRLTNGFEALGEIPAGSVVEFDARVTEYLKRPFRGAPERQRCHSERGPDYRLSFPSRIQIVGG